MNTSNLAASNALEILRERALRGIDQKYDGQLKDLALLRIEEELAIIDKQGSAFEYNIVSGILNVVSASQGEVITWGTTGSSLISYAIGLSNIEPLDSTPKLYPEFFFGINGEILPDFEIHVKSSVYPRILQYIDDHKDELNVMAIKKYETLTKVGWGKWSEDNNCNDPSSGTFYIFIGKRGEDQRVRDALLSGQVIDVCKPKDFAEYVKCYGLEHGTGTWEDNAEMLFKEGRVPLQDLIAHREDVYELLIDYGVEKPMAYSIAQYVRKGKVNAHGWRSEMWEALYAAKVPDWFISSCEKIRYLFPRSHAMQLYSML